MAYFDNVKSWRNQFFRVREGRGCPKILMNDFGILTFPLNWNQNVVIRFIA